MKNLFVFLGCMSSITVWALCAEAAPVISTVDCQVGEVSVLSNRIHVKCSTQYIAGTDTKIALQIIRYFALPIGSTLERFEAERLSLLATRTPSGRLRVTFDANDTSATSYGCAKSDCRRPIVLSTVP